MPLCYLYSWKFHQSATHNRDKKERLMREHGQVPTRVENEILVHHVITENPYLDWFSSAEEGPSNAQVKELIIQMSVLLQESVIIRRKRGIVAEKADYYISDTRFREWLQAVANAMPIDVEKDLKGHILGSVALATRETTHALHQLGRTYGSSNERKRAGASFALGIWAGYGLGKAGGKNFLYQIIDGIRRHNIARRHPKGLPVFSDTPFSMPFYPEQVNAERVLRQMKELHEFDVSHDADWFFGAKQALDALWVFWFGLDKRKFTLA
ncbi:MAG: hypothetical protein HYY92_01195 [Parcubacteria group bacterium]|nr:hypothetical protein [Parcubacteria group bacterium]